MPRKPDVDLPALEALLGRVFGRGFTYQRTESGSSTQVYRVVVAGETFYARMAEEVDASFAPEAELHRVLVAAGARVPDVVHYEPFDEALERSVLVTTEIVGSPLGAATTEREAASIGEAAGRDLARIHAVPVQGFGWVQREHGRAGWPIRGEHPTYAAYVDPPSVAAPLVAVGFTVGQADGVVRLLEEAVELGPPSGVGSVAHGDFDASHIYEVGGTYSGLIDFGEIRGTDYTFDFATLWMNAEEAPPLTEHIERGYAELRPLPDDHRRRVYVACVLSASHRLATWHRRDGAAAADSWFFRWVRDRLAELLKEPPA